MDKDDKGNEAVSLNVVRQTFELLFSLNLSFAIVSIVDLEAHPVLSPFFSLEFSINKLLHIRQTDFIRGYIAFTASTVALALCFWLALRLSAGVTITKRILRSLAGPVLLVAPSSFWLYLYQKQGWPFGWPYRWAPLELALALVCAWLYIGGRWRFPIWFGVLLLGAHYAYWFWIFGGNYFASNYSGPAAPILGFSSALAWAIYVRRLPKESASAFGGEIGPEAGRTAPTGPASA